MCSRSGLDHQGPVRLGGSLWEFRRITRWRVPSDAEPWRQGRASARKICGPNSSTILPRIVGKTGDPRGRSRRRRRPRSSIEPSGLAISCASSPACGFTGFWPSNLCGDAFFLLKTLRSVARGGPSPESLQDGTRSRGPPRESPPPRREPTSADDRGAVWRPSSTTATGACSASSSSGQRDRRVPGWPSPVRPASPGASRTCGGGCGAHRW